MQEITIRKAIMGDVKGIHAMLMVCAREGLLLPRALSHLYRHIRDFYVAETADNTLVACCALAPSWDDLAEICSLVVTEPMRKLGLGRRIVEACVKDCVDLQIGKVFALTYQEEFFTRLGFSIVEKDVLPQKIWADCVHCPKYPDCDETAVMLTLGGDYGN